MSTYPAHGSSGSVAAGANAVAKVTSWTYDGTCDVAEVTYMGSTSKVYKPGLLGGGGTIDCVLDADDTGQVALTAGSEVTLTLYPDGETSNDDKWSGSVVIASEGIAASVDGIETRSFTYSGVLTQGDVT